VFVRVGSSIRQGGVLCIEEEQTIVYRGDGPPIPTTAPAAVRPWAEGVTVAHWLPRRTELFRYSAVTFNAHRIHYDLPYATSTEGYPDLVVHGPLTALRCAPSPGSCPGRLHVSVFAARRRCSSTSRSR
jgi:hydroxyacyl-ACP dehydratase HTD2-like protein with hotdog domain